VKTEGSLPWLQSSPVDPIRSLLHPVNTLTPTFFKIILISSASLCLHVSHGVTPLCMAGPKHVPPLPLGRLIIWRSFKSILFKYLFTIYLVRAEETNFLLIFTFRQLCKESYVVTWVTWHHISDLFQWYSSTPYSLASPTAARLVRPLIRSCPYVSTLKLCIYHSYEKNRMCPTHHPPWFEDTVHVTSNRPNYILTASSTYRCVITEFEARALKNRCSACETPLVRVVLLGHGLFGLGTRCSRILSIIDP
jgi:hypothetical protein